MSSRFTSSAAPSSASPRRPCCRAPAIWILRANTPELPAARQCRVFSLSRFLSLGSRPAVARPGQGAASARTAGSVYGLFTEGFDTRDLREAKALLEELAA